MDRKLFGTDGIRGIANLEPLTPETIIKIGRAIAFAVKNKQKKTSYKILIGKDTRISGALLETAMASGICSMGVDVILAGVLPTPGIALLTKELEADSGIVLSASHNSFEDNGIKLFSSSGLKLLDKEEEDIEKIIYSEELNKIRPTSEQIGKISLLEGAENRYIEFIDQSSDNLSISGLKIVLDCANGSGYKIAPQVLKKLGATVLTINHTPNGININQECGATNIKALKEIVLLEQADLGIALDGDGDRVIFVDEKGEKVDGDSILGICALDMLKKNILKNNTIVVTIMSNLGLDFAIKEQGGKIIRTNVGDRYVFEGMVKHDAILGGENSGHLIFREYNPTGDGLLSSLQLLKIIKEQNSTLSQLSQSIKKFPQTLINVKVKDKPPLNEIHALQKQIQEGEKILDERGRIVIRYSGTEAKIRVMVEGEDEHIISEISEKLVHTIKETIGA